jgi:WD40-like Beta Propeller Repeat
VRVAIGLAVGSMLVASGCTFSRNAGQAPDEEPPDAGTTLRPVKVQMCNGLCADFSSSPVLAPGTPAGAASMFRGNGTGPGPCVTEPEDGTLLPNNWLRPRVKVSAPGVALLEIRFHSSKEANDLVVYTASDNWTMDKNTWRGLAGHVVDAPIQISVRAVGPAGLTGSSTTSFTIAPIGASGKMVYWALRGFDATKSDNTELVGFGVGDERVASVLKVPEIQQTTSGASFSCIGCHTATPDGAFVGFTGNYPWTNALASVEAGNTGKMPDFLGTAGVDALTGDWHGIITFSGSHWAKGDHIGVTSLGTQPVDPSAKLIWMELDTGASGAIARQGDPAGAAAPNFSHDGTRIVYTSTNANQDGRLGVGTADLYVVPYADRAGGAASMISGAAEPDFAEYYPAFSPDDRFVAFNRLSQADASFTPTGQPYDGGMYFNPAAEVWVVPSAGGTAVRLKANDPPACTPAVRPNPGVYPSKTGWDNSWAKWSPEVGVVNDRKFYWLIFSSYRYDISPPRGQLYMTAIVTTGTTVTTYPAVHLWNQDLTTSNHTPAWEAFQIPPII